MLVSSVGLLKRKNWARVSVVALLALWVLWNIATLVMIYLFGMQDGQLAAGQPHSVFIQLFMLVFLVAVSALLIWIIRKLVSPTIVEEFTS